MQLDQQREMAALAYLLVLREYLLQEAEAEAGIRMMARQFPPE